LDTVLNFISEKVGRKRSGVGVQVKQDWSEGDDFETW
jgi:hypothetical protein